MRKRFRCTILFLSIIFSSMTPGIKAQEAYDGGLLENFGVSAKIGTYGPGIDFHTSLLPNLKARVGFNYLSYNNTEKSILMQIIYCREIPGYWKETLRMPN